MSGLDDLRLQAGRLMEACAAINATADDQSVKLRRRRQTTLNRKTAPQLAGTRGARH